MVHLIVGLGNPGAKYVLTRHNVGFMVVERFVPPEVVWRDRFHSAVAQIELRVGLGVVALKPLTFMNHSGKGVGVAAKFFKVPAERVVVVHDELDLPFGQLKLRRGGGEGGHNGLRSISETLGSTDYIRLRVGIGRPADDFKGRVSDFVLQRFAPAQAVELSRQLERSVEAIKLVLSDGPDAAMNEINRKRTRPNSI